MHTTLHTIRGLPPKAPLPAMSAPRPGQPEIKCPRFEDGVIPPEKLTPEIRGRIDEAYRGGKYMGLWNLGMAHDDYTSQKEHLAHMKEWAAGLTDAREISEYKTLIPLKERSVQAAEYRLAATKDVVAEHYRDQPDMLRLMDDLFGPVQTSRDAQFASNYVQGLIQGTIKPA